MENPFAFQILQQIRELYGQINLSFAHSEACTAENTKSKVGHLTPQQLLIVKLIGHEGKTTISALCQQMSLSKGTVSGIVSRMVAMDILEKHHDEDDRRTVWIRFSPSGKKLAMQFRSHMSGVLDALVKDFTLEEQAELSKNLNRLIQSVKSGN